MGRSTVSNHWWREPSSFWNGWAVISCSLGAMARFNSPTRKESRSRHAARIWRLAQRPLQARRLGPQQKIADRAGGEATTAPDCADRQIVLLFQTQDFDDLTHNPYFSRPRAVRFDRPSAHSTFCVTLPERSYSRSLPTTPLSRSDSDGWPAKHANTRQNKRWELTRPCLGTVTV